MKIVAARRIATSANFAWTGAGGDGKFSTAANWNVNAAPSSGVHVRIDAAGDQTLVCDLAKFSPLSLTLSDASGRVTLNAANGAAFSHLMALTNSTDRHHAVNVPIAFADNAVLSFNGLSTGAGAAVDASSVTLAGKVRVFVSGTVAQGVNYALLSGVGSAAASSFELAGCPVPAFLNVADGQLWLVAGTPYTWTGLAGSAWGAGGNWFGGAVPAGSCTAYFNDCSVGSKTVSFDKAYSYTGVLNVETGTEASPVRFTATAAANGLSLGNKALSIGQTGGAALSVESGSYGSINAVYLGGHDKSRMFLKNGTVSVNGWICIGYNDSSSSATSDSAIVISGGTFKNTAAQLSIGDKGRKGAKAELKVTGGVCESANNIIVGQRGKATLNVGGGTVRAKGSVVFCNTSGAFESGEDCAVNLTGGVLETKSVTYGSGSAGATLTFNGGTLKALADGTLIVAKDKLSVKVGKNGGTINTNGKTVTIAENLEPASGSTGGLSFTGGGTAALSGSVTYTGATKVAAGTGVRSSSAGRKLAGALEFAAGAKMSVGLANGEYTGFAAKDVSLAGDLNVSVDSDVGGTLPILTKTGGGTFTAADVAKVKVVNAAGRALVALLSDDAKSICLEPSELNAWTGPAEGGKMSASANWSHGRAPTKSEKIVFKSAATVNADLGDVLLGGVTLNGNVTFNGSLRTKKLAGWTKLIVGANATVTLEGDLSVVSGQQCLAKRVDANGRFVVTGVVRSNGLEISPTADGGAGYVVVNGVVLSGGKLLQATTNKKNGNWAVGAAGITGAGSVWCLSDAKNSAVFRPWNADFAISVPTVVRTNFGRYELNTTGLDGAGRTITLNGGYADNGKMYITGNGRVVCNCVPTASNGKSAYSGAVQVGGTATLAVNTGRRLTNGDTTFNAGTTLSLPGSASGTVELGGLVKFNSGAKLAFAGLKSGVTPLKVNKINIYTSNGVGTRVSLSSGGVAPGEGTYTLFTATGQNLIADHASRLSLDDAALAGYTVTFSLTSDKKSVQVKISRQKASAASAAAPAATPVLGGRHKAGFDAWCAEPGNDGTDANAVDAYLMGVPLAGFAPLTPTRVEKFTDADGKTRLRITTDCDLSKANGVVYLQYGATLGSMKSVRCELDGAAAVSQPLDDDGASGFFRVCIGEEEPAE